MLLPGSSREIDQRPRRVRDPVLSWDTCIVNKETLRAGLDVFCELLQRGFGVVSLRSQGVFKLLLEFLLLGSVLECRIGQFCPSRRHRLLWWFCAWDKAQVGCYWPMIDPGAGGHDYAMPRG